MFGLFRLRGADAQVHIADAAKAFRFDADDVVRIGRNDRHDVQVDRTGQHDAVVVIGVVAADLGTAGGRVEAHRAVGAKLLGKMVDRLHVPRTLGRQRRVVPAVQFGKSAVIQALCDLLFQFTGVRHNFNSPFLWAALLPTCTKSATLFWVNSQNPGCSRGSCTQYNKFWRDVNIFLLRLYGLLMNRLL